LADLVDVAHDLVNGHSLSSWWGWVATGAFWATLAAAALAVSFLAQPSSRTPHAIIPIPATDSLFYYRDVVSRGTAAAYENEVVALTPQQLNCNRAVEAFGLARIAEKKANRTRWAFIFAGLFLLLWPTARVALALAS